MVMRLQVVANVAGIVAKIGFSLVMYHCDEINTLSTDVRGHIHCGYSISGS